jgi:hypothetical protein
MDLDLYINLYSFIFIYQTLSYFNIGADPFKQTPQESPGPILIYPLYPHFLPHEFCNFQ